MDYDTIKTVALSYSDREDAEVSDRMDNFLRMVESRVNRKLRVSDMSMRATLTAADQEYYGLPPDFGGLRDIEYQTDGGKKTTMKYMSPEQLNGFSNLEFDGFTSNLIFYNIIAGQLNSRPLKDTGTYEIIYYQKLVALDGTNTTNWLSDDNPDCYIFGLLVEISSFVKDAKTAALWDVRFKESLEEMSSMDSTDRWSGTSLETRVG